MNYIKLLNAAFETFHTDDRMHPAHISLYMALFQEWNASRFANEIFVNRRDLMLVSKIGSNSSYHRTITDLDAWDYLSYFPSNSPYKGSKIKMSVLWTGDSQVLETDRSIYEPVAVRYPPTRAPVSGQYHPVLEQLAERYRPNGELTLGTTINKTKGINNTKRPKGRQGVSIFFNKKGFDADEGKKFFDHYEANDWKTSDGKAIRDWQALAINWMDRTELFKAKNNPNKKQASQKQDNLRTSKNKDYGQPL